MSEEKRAEFSPRAFLWSEGPEYISLIKIPECEERKRMAWMSVAEHQFLLTAAKKKLRIAREAMLDAKNHLEENNEYDAHLAMQEALAKLGGADEQS